MHPILFHVGNITIYSFGLFLALGIVAGGVLTAILARRVRIPTKGLFDDILFIIFIGAVGARLAYVIAYPSYFRAPTGNWFQALAIWQGGLVFYGAIIGGLIAACYVLRHESKNLLRWLDILMIALALGLSFGQVGCFLGDCASGISSSSRFAIDHKIPVQLFESGWAIFLAVVGSIMYIFNSKLRKGGKVFFGGGLLLFAARLLIDFWRPATLKWGGASAYLWMDIVVLLLITIVMVYLVIKRRVGIENSLAE